ncbi:hypothetical protein BOX15_Mlig006110g1 [Macrostomum lignano]|uniref:LRAT domain-containing protein n=1 Tax=Macrostomum lignano TaxID=282301 RepID=A0A267F1E3_9PLAT|nr:hypothetical protein BOX15_Mlig006110g1 [Macrostomum lignano]
MDASNRVAIRSAKELNDACPCLISFLKILPYYHEAFLRDSRVLSKRSDILQATIYEYNHQHKTVRKESLDLSAREKVQRVEYPGTNCENPIDSSVETLSDTEQTCENPIDSSVETLLGYTFLEANADVNGSLASFLDDSKFKVQSSDFCYFLKTNAISDQELENVACLFPTSPGEIKQNQQKVENTCICMEEIRNLKRYDHIILERTGVKGETSKVHFVLTEWDSDSRKGVGVTFENPAECASPRVNKVKVFLRVSGPNQLMKVEHKNPINPSEVDERFKAREGETNYCLCTNNCENFVYYLIYGEPRSPQIEFWSFQLAKVAPALLKCTASIAETIKHRSTQALKSIQSIKFHMGLEYLLDNHKLFFKLAELLLRRELTKVCVSFNNIVKHATSQYQRSTQQLVHEVVASPIKPLLEQLSGLHEVVASPIKPLLEQLSRLHEVVASPIKPLLEQLSRLHEVVASPIKPLLEQLSRLHEVVASPIKPLLEQLSGLHEVVASPIKPLSEQLSGLHEVVASPIKPLLEQLSRLHEVVASPIKPLSEQLSGLHEVVASPIKPLLEQLPGLHEAVASHFKPLSEQLSRLHEAVASPIKPLLEQLPGLHEVVASHIKPLLEQLSGLTGQNSKVVESLMKKFSSLSTVDQIGLAIVVALILFDTYRLVSSKNTSKTKLFELLISSVKQLLPWWCCIGASAPMTLGISVGVHFVLPTLRYLRNRFDFAARVQKCYCTVVSSAQTMAKQINGIFEGFAKISGFKNYSVTSFLNETSLSLAEVKHVFSCTLRFGCA